MRIDWSKIGLWDFHRVGNVWAVKVSPTAVSTGVSDSRRDKNVKIEVYSTDTDKLIGYTLWERKIGPKPRSIVRPSYLALFYSNIPNNNLSIRKPIKIIYHDYNVRLLAFGKKEDKRDYMMVLRARPQE